MKKEFLPWLAGAFLSALAATTCCLPALLFLLFGLSFGGMSFLEYLTPFRIPLSLLSLIFLGLSWYRYRRKNVVCCAARKQTKIISVYGLIAIVLLALLTYPEWLGWWLGGE